MNVKRLNKLARVLESDLPIEYDQNKWPCPSEEGYQTCGCAGHVAEIVFDSFAGVDLMDFFDIDMHEEEYIFGMVNWVKSSAQEIGLPYYGFTAKAAAKRIRRLIKENQK